jgi:hypothetical protein
MHNIFSNVSEHRFHWWHWLVTVALRVFLLEGWKGKQNFATDGFDRGTATICLLLPCDPMLFPSFGFAEQMSDSPLDVRFAISCWTMRPFKLNFYMRTADGLHFTRKYVSHGVYNKAQGEENVYKISYYERCRIVPPLVLNMALHKCACYCPATILR